jgi:octaprenyl-diphosphate synthase
MKELEKVKTQIEQFVKEIGHTQSLKLLNLLANGKMLRSKLILKIAGVNTTSIKLCAIVEMIHLASLLHDDVIDEANTRRGKPSINAIFDNKTAIMFGDILYSKAFTQLTYMPKNIAYEISNAVTLLSVGEMLDIELSQTFNTSYDNYLDMIYKKTSSLIEATAKSSAILANKNKTAFGIYGKNLGLAFQMIDDILDITQNSETLGKPAMLDFVEGKVTIRYLLLWERLDDKDKQKLKKMYKKPLDENELNWIKQNMTTTNALQDSIKMAHKFGNTAIESIKDEQNQELVDIMLSMIKRSY